MSTKLSKGKYQQQHHSMIAAVIHISESELAAAYPEYTADWETTIPTVFAGMLFNLGLDTSQNYSRQEPMQHRNRLNRIVTCCRWYGNERADNEWIKSGYASRAAIDRNTNNKVLDSLYREKALTVDTQFVLEQRDLHYENKEIKQVEKLKARRKRKQDRLAGEAAKVSGDDYEAEWDKLDELDDKQREDFN